MTRPVVIATTVRASGWYHGHPTGPWVAEVVRLHRNRGGRTERVEILGRCDHRHRFPEVARTCADGLLVVERLDDALRLRQVDTP